MGLCKVLDSLLRHIQFQEKGQQDPSDFSSVARLQETRHSRRRAADGQETRHIRCHCSARLHLHWTSASRPLPWSHCPCTSRRSTSLPCARRTPCISTQAHRADSIPTASVAGVARRSSPRCAAQAWTTCVCAQELHIQPMTSTASRCVL